MYESGYPAMIIQLETLISKRPRDLLSEILVRLGTGSHLHVAENEDPDVPSLKTTLEHVKVQLSGLADLGSLQARFG